MKSIIGVAQLSCNPCEPGRWWLCMPQSSVVADWLDVLAGAAQKKWPGRVATLDQAATLISNLRVWENLILPVWKREGGRYADFEDAVVALFDLAGVTQDERTALVARLPAMLDRTDRRLVMLLRSVFIAPECVIIEDDIWQDLCLREIGTPQGRLFAKLQDAPCLIVVGASPATPGFAPVRLEGEK